MSVVGGFVPGGRDMSERTGVAPLTSAAGLR
jgi:hypothetical protein